MRQTIVKDKNRINLRWQTFVLLTLAGIINAFGVTMFLAPVQLYDSGISGTSMLLWQLTPETYTLSLFLLILNLPIFLYGCKKQGMEFTVCSVYAVAVYSIAAYLITYEFPVDVAASSPFAGNDLLLCAVFGGIISGIGSGLTIRFGGAIDGIEVLAVIFSKRIGVTVGTFVMLYNVLLYILVGVVLQSWTLPLYSIITYALALKTIDFIVEGFDRAKAATIITSAPDEIGRALSEAFGSGITLVPAQGYYSSEHKTMIYFVVNRFQIARMRAVVMEQDPGAFISITEVADVFGSYNKEKKKLLSGKNTY